MRKLADWLPSLAGKRVCKYTELPQRCRLGFANRLAELENDTGKEFMGSLRNEPTSGCAAGLGNFPDVRTDKTKRRVYDEARDLLGNYKTFRCK